MIQKLKDDELLVATHKAVHEERMQTLCVIEHLEEIYARRLHLRKGYGSFQAFLVGEKLYNEGCAHRRVSAMKLVQELPAARVALADGSLSLSTASVVQNFFKTERMDHKKSYSIEEKKQILEKVARASVKECSAVLSKVSPTYAAPKPEIKINDDAELRALLEEFRVLSMSAKDDPSILIKSALKTAIKALKQRSTATAPVARARSPMPAASNVFTKPSSAKVSRYIPKKDKRTVWQMSRGRCSFVTPNGQRCGSTYKLDIDHILPHSHEGASSAENLRLLCKPHHSLVTEIFFGSS